MDHLSAADIRAMLDMKPHPEGGHYVETYRETGGESLGTGTISSAIYFLLEAGEVSHWHRLSNATEIWHFYAGAPLVITVSPNGHDAQAHRMGANLALGERPQMIVPAGWWQTATSLGHWTLVGCTMAPGFTFDAFELAPPDWRPTPREPRGS